MDILQIVAWVLAGIIAFVIVLTAILTLTSWLKERSAKQEKKNEVQLTPPEEKLDEQNKQ